MLTPPLRLKQSHLVPPSPTTTVTPKLFLLLHPILPQWDKRARHSTPGVQSSSFCLCLFPSDFLSLRSGDKD